jgi:membrane-associated protease RseP (regulator of RpoE activity)
MSAGLGYVLFFLVILVVVLIHESGHFFVAKAFRIKVEEFFVGFGPRLWSVRRGETEYGVKALPFGGYVRIAGMNPFQPPTPEEYPRTYQAKPLWQRALVILAGPVTHFLIAFVTLAVVAMALGIPNAHRPMVGAVHPTLNGRPSPAFVAGLQAGDQILSLDGRSMTSLQQVIVYTRGHDGRPIQMTIRRDGRVMTLTVTPVLTALPGEQEAFPRIGVQLDEVREREGLVTAVKGGGVGTWQAAKQVVIAMKNVFGPSALRRIGDLLVGNATRRETDPTSLIGAGRIAGQAAASNAWDVFLGLIVVFNVFIGILNLVPLPPLDGGHLAVLAYEAIRRKRPDPRKLVPITTLVAGFIILYAVAVMYLDIVKPIPNPFP